MNKVAIGKAVLSVAGVGLTLLAGLVNDKIKDDKLNDTIAKKVAEKVEETLQNQTKES